MAEKKIVLVDTDILIKIFRQNKVLKQQLDELENQIAISAVTVFELLEGANTEKKLFELLKQLKAYRVLHLDEDISLKTFSLFKIHKPKDKMFIADTLIAATALVHNLELFTDNKKDYQFIKEIKFYNPK